MPRRLKPSQKKGNLTDWSFFSGESGSRVCRVCMRCQNAAKGLLPFTQRSRDQKFPGIRFSGNVLFLTWVSLSFQANIVGMFGQQAVLPGSLLPGMNSQNVPSASRQTRLFFKLKAGQKQRLVQMVNWGVHAGPEW